MAFLKLAAALVCMGIFVTRTHAQFDPLFFLRDLGENLFESFGDGGSRFMLFNHNNLNRRIQELEANIRTGAVGGCASGLIGPFTPTSRMQSFTFSNNFLLPPAITFAVTDLTTVDATQIVDFTVRPMFTSATGGTVTLTDANDNIASLTVSYFACPSSASAAMSSMGTGNGFNLG